jgi:tRNA A-37 threonylcarbamoyl transferase component Bud32
MKRCPRCSRSFEDALSHCPNDGAELVAQPPAKDPMIGRILAERYEVLELLGRGGFGVVYKVLDRKMDDVVAVKVFDRRRFTEEEAHQAIQRFRREGVLLRRLGKRTNKIVIVYDFEEDEEEELIYFTMDYVEGTTLTEILAEEGPLPLPRLLDLSLQVCQALKAAHSEGIVHRDLKLENVMITREGDREIVKVLDFGIAKMVGAQSLTNLAMGVPGTAGFAPPEQLQRPQDIDHRTDLFALGVVLYGLLTGHSPWNGEPIAEPTSSEKIWDLIRGSLQDAPIPIKQWRSDVPKQLDTVICKLLEKDQARRIQSADLLEEELRGIRSSILGEPETGEGSGPIKAFGALARRARVPPALAAGGLLVLLVSAAAVFWAISRSVPTVTLDQFREAAESGRVLEAGFHGGEMRTVMRGLDGEVGDVKVRLQGVPVQALARELRDREIPLRAEGRSNLRVLTVAEGNGPGGAGAAGSSAGRTPMEASGTMIFLDGPVEACSPCTHSQEIPLQAGWYAVRASGEEWNLQSIILRDTDGVFREEEVGLGEASLFVPDGASLELVSEFTPTETRVLLTRAGEAVPAGDPEEALSLVRRVLETVPDHSWALALRDSVFMDAKDRVLAAFAAADVANARRWLSLCQEDDPQDQDCHRVQSWLDNREQAEGALRGGRTTQAVQLAQRCLGLNTGDTECRRIQEEGEARLAAAQEAQQDRPPTTRPVSTPANPPVEAGAESPPPGRADPTREAVTAPPISDTVRSAADTGREPQGATETPTTTSLPALSTSNLTLRGFRFVDSQFLLEGGFTSVGPGDAPVCLASVFGNQDLEPFSDADGAFALSGWVAVTERYVPGTTPRSASFSHALPVSQLHRDRGTFRVVAITRIWAGECAEAVIDAPPLAQAVTKPICIVRYPAGWGLCRG